MKLIDWTRVQFQGLLHRIMQLSIYKSINFFSLWLEVFMWLFVCASHKYLLEPFFLFF